VLEHVRAVDEIELVVLEGHILDRALVDRSRAERHRQTETARVIQEGDVGQMGRVHVRHAAAPDVQHCLASANSEPRVDDLLRSQVKHRRPGR